MRKSGSSGHGEISDLRPSPPRLVADVAGTLTSVLPSNQGVWLGRRSSDVWAGEKGLPGRKGVGEGSASQGLGDSWVLHSRSGAERKPPWSARSCPCSCYLFALIEAMHMYYLTLSLASVQRPSLSPCLSNREVAEHGRVMSERTGLEFCLCHHLSDLEQVT